MMMCGGVICATSVAVNVVDVKATQATIANVAHGLKAVREQ
jgi:hypothetical protein